MDNCLRKDSLQSVHRTLGLGVCSSYHQWHSLGGLSSFDYDIVVGCYEASKSLDFSVAWVRKYDGVCAMFACMHLGLMTCWQIAEWDAVGVSLICTSIF